MSRTSTTYDTIVIGAGFYGLAIAHWFATHRKQRVLVLERESQALHRASRLNQARVHGGYHYPNSFITALRCRENFDRFVSDYAESIVRPKAAYYAIAREQSSISADQFAALFQRISAPIKPAPAEVSSLFSPELIEAVFQVEEYCFDADRLRERLLHDCTRANVEIRLHSEALRMEALPGGGSRVQFNHVETAEGARVFVATYSELNSVLGPSGLETIPLRKELTEIALCRTQHPALVDTAFTVMCGPFFSVMPFPSRQLLSFSHVRFTPLVKWSESTGNSPDTKVPFLRGASQNAGDSSRFPSMLQDAKRYMPVLDQLGYVASNFETKAILPRNDADDGRPILFRKVSPQQNVYAVLGGKIDNIYDVYAQLEGVS